MSDSDQNEGNRNFATTHWSIVLAAGHKSSPDTGSVGVIGRS